MNIKDKVRILSWNNILKKYNSYSLYNDNLKEEIFINTPKYGYDEGIKKYCGKVYTISEVIKEGFYKLDGIDDYIFTNEILKFLEEKNENYST